MQQVEVNLKEKHEYTRKDKDEQIQYKLPFGGGIGAGGSISPIAFLVIQSNNVKLLPINHCSTIDKLLDYVPDLIEKTNEILNKKMDNKKEEETQSTIKLHPKRNKTISYEYKNSDLEDINKNEFDD